MNGGFVQGGRMSSDTATNDHEDAPAPQNRPDYDHGLMHDRQLTCRSGRLPRSATVTETSDSPWLTVHEAAERCKCGVKVIYREVKAGRLRAARIGGRRELRLLAAWVDEWLIASTTVLWEGP